MRYAPAATALALLAALTSSAGQGSAPDPLDPRAAVLLEQGRGALGAGNADAAVDAFEAALAIQPGRVETYLGLAEATRKQGMQGKALHYYRAALLIDSASQSALAGEGEALVEKGAVEKARRNLARLQQLCGGDCVPAQQLAAAIRKGPAPQVVSAEAPRPASGVVQK